MPTRKTKPKTEPLHRGRVMPTRKTKPKTEPLPKLLVVRESSGATRLFLEDGTEIPAVKNVTAWAEPGQAACISFEIGPIEFVHLPKRPKGVR